MKLSAALMPWCAAAAALFLGAGLYMALFVAPPDYQQGESVRIMYVHVPAAWLASLAYALMAGASAVGLIWRHPLAHVAAEGRIKQGELLVIPALGAGLTWGACILRW